MEAIAVEIGEKQNQAEIEKLKRLEEERSQQKVEEGKCLEKEVEEQTQESSDVQKTDIESSRKEVENQKDTKQKKEVAAAKQTDKKALLPLQQSPTLQLVGSAVLGQSNSKNFPPREVPPRFKQQKMQPGQTSAAKKDSSSPPSSDFGTWHNPGGDGSGGAMMPVGMAGWGLPPNPGGTGAEIIVDSQDKEAWPSIGDRSSESASESGDMDNASVKSGSVISSSSNPGQGHSDSQGQSQGQSSSVWGATYGISEEKMDSTSNWGSNTGSLSSGVWGSTSPNSMASQGNMQTSNSSITASNSQANNQSLGWGINNGHNSMNVTSGAQTSSGMTAMSRDSMSQSEGFSNNMGNSVWQSMGGIGSGLPKSDTSAWNMPNSSSVMASSLSISQASPGNSISAQSATSGMTDQWGQPGGISSPGPTGWGDPDPKITESTGWGDPDPTPITNAGTEGWGAPESSKPPQAWGASDRMSSGSGWGQPPPSKPTTGGWNQPEKRWAEAEPPKPVQPPGWSQSEPQRPGPSAWGAPGDDKPNPPSQWGAANPQQSQWGGGSQQNSAQGAWGMSNNQSRAIGYQPSMSQLPPQPQQPSTWAQAAGRGLPPRKPQTAINPAPPGARMSPQDDMISEAINSHDGWGKMPVRQDSSWDAIEATPRPAPPKPAPSQDDPNLFHQPNNGTAIWEAAKESAPPPVRSQPSRNSGASGGSGEWISDNDSGTWNGPPGQESSNTWNGPPYNHSRIGGGSSSSGSSNGGGYDNKSNTWGASSEAQWESKDNTWNNNNKESLNEKGGEDNVWDRDGTGVWGDPGKGPKMETGTWQPPTRRSSSSAGSWSGEEESRNWGVDHPHAEPPRGGVDDGTAYWGDPHPQPNKLSRQWSSQQQPGMPHGQPITGQRPPDDKGPMGWGPPSQPSKSSGWGEPSPPVKTIDDGSAMWAQPGMTQGKPGGWGDGQWPGAKPKAPSSSGWNDDWNKQNMAKGPMGPGYGVVGKNQPPQMRSRLLQQLTDMGFKKEAAQNALISNNMNLESAIADLVNGAGGKPGEMNEPLGRQVRGMGNEDCGDPMENSHFPPSMSMHQNAPYTSAQAHLSNSQVIANQLKHGVQVLGPDGQDHGFPLNKGPSLPTPSSLSSMTNSSINPNVSLQQKLLQQQQLAKQQQMAAAQGAPVRTVQSVQQQLIQQQIVQQLQMAVQAGLISPQLLNQQLTPTMLVMLQQLLQLQQVLQRLVAQQQVIQQNRSINNAQKVQQLDQIHITIQRIKQQIVQQQQQIAQAQAALAKQAPPTAGAQPTMDPTKDLLKDLPTEMNKLQFKESANPATQSRLQQWTKLPSQEKDQTGLIGDGLNKAVGSKPNSSAGLPFSDSTWSSSLSSGGSTSSWPSNTSTYPSTIDRHASASDPISATSAVGSSASSTSSNSSNSSGAALDIEEFVPGKPWTGAATKSVEDDPFMTPGSARQGALTIKEEYVTSALRRMSSSPSNPNAETSQSLTSSWNSLTKTSSPSNLAKQANWSSSNSLTSESPASSLASELWGVPAVPKPNRPPPGLGNQKSSMYPPQPYNRSVSWAPDGSTMTPNSSMSSSNIVSNWLSLKNLTPQIDGSTLKTLCMQHGPLQTFYLNLNYGQAIVRYSTKEEALKAQKSLNHCLLGNTTILADFVSDSEVPQMVEQSQHGGSQGNLSTPWSGGSQQKQPPMRSVSSYPAMTGLGRDQWNGSSNFGSSVGMWGSGGGSLWAPTLEDHTPGLLPGDLLGSQ